MKSSLKSTRTQMNDNKSTLKKFTNNFVQTINVVINYKWLRSDEVELNKRIITKTIYNTR